MDFGLSLRVLNIVTVFADSSQNNKYLPVGLIWRPEKTCIMLTVVICYTSQSNVDVMVTRTFGKLMAILDPLEFHRFGQDSLDLDEC